MQESLTIDEMRGRFRDEWVLVEDPETSASLAVMGGRVLWHSRDRDEVYRKAGELRPRHSAIVHTGELPDRTAVVL